MKGWKMKPGLRRTSVVGKFFGTGFLRQFKGRR
jgi:hypothetical protein